MTVGTMLNTGHITPANIQKQSFASAIARYQPNGTAKLLALSSMMKRETAINTVHGYFAKSMVFPTVVTHGSTIALANTTITVASTANIIPGMVLRVGDGSFENLLVVSITNATTFVVQRAFGNVVAADIPATTTLYMVGTAYEEASNRSLPYSLDTVAVENYTQIFRNSWAVSGSAAAVQVIAGQKVDSESKMDCMTFHGRDIEFMAIYGQRKTTTGPNGKPIRASEGIYGNLNRNASGNIVALGSTTSYTQMENALDKCFDTAVDGIASDERILFVGGVARRVINNIGRLNSDGSGWSVSSGETMFGLKFESFKCARGTFHLIEHPLLNAYGPTAPQAATAIALHLPTVNFAYLGGRDTKAESYGLGGSVTQGSATDQSGVDAMGGSLTSELTMQFKNPSANAIVTGFTAAAVG